MVKLSDQQPKLGLCVVAFDSCLPRSELHVIIRTKRCRGRSATGLRTLSRLVHFSQPWRRCLGVAFTKVSSVVASRNTDEQQRPGIRKPVVLRWMFPWVGNSRALSSSERCLEATAGVKTCDGSNVVVAYSRAMSRFLCCENYSVSKQRWTSGGAASS
jgi:hypothetical protein